MKTRSLLLIFSFVSGSFFTMGICALVFTQNSLYFISRENEREKNIYIQRQFEPKAHAFLSQSSANSSIYKFSPSSGKSKHV